MSGEKWDTYIVEKEMKIHNGECEVEYKISGNSISGSCMCRKDVEMLIEMLTEILKE